MTDSRDSNVVLIGFMGSGKTSVGHVLSERLDKAFLDTDKILESAHDASISELFSDGEPQFRDLETAVCHDLKNVKNAVIATGGGMPLQSENGRILRDIGWVVYLSADLDTILDRLKGDNARPLLTEYQDIKQRWTARLPIYESTADCTIRVDGLSISAVADAICDRFNTYSAA